MKKRLKNSIISIALALMMVVTYTPLAGITGIGGGTAEAASIEAEINGKQTSLIDAYSIARDTPGVQTIKILTDLTNPKYMFSANGTEVIFDLNGHTITTDVQDEKYIQMKFVKSCVLEPGYVSSKVTYKNGTINGITGSTGGETTYENVTINGGVIIYNVNGAKVNFKSGKINAKYGPAVYVMAGTFNATGGEIVAQSGQYCIDLYGTNSNNLNLSGNVKLTGNALTNTGTTAISITGGTYTDSNIENYLTGTYVLKDGKVAQGTAVASIGSTRYVSLDKAASAATSGNTIKLLGDISNVAFTAPSGKKLTLDLNGHKLSGTNKDAFNFNSYCNSASNKCTLEVNDSTAELTVTDSSSAKNGTIDGTVGIKNGKFTLANGKITGGVYMTGDSAVLNVTGGEVRDKWETLCWNSGTVNITGGKVVGGTAAGVIVYMCNSDKAKFNISGLATIEGSSFSAMSTPFNKGNVQITGGYYNKDIVKDYLTEDYSLVNSTSKSGYYEVKGAERASIGNTKYTTLAKAVTAAKTGDTIKLLEDMSGVALAAPGNKKITLDLNGHKLTGANKANYALGDFAKSTSTKLTLEVNVSTAELTVTDSSAAKTGTIDGAVGVKNGKFTLTAGKITGGVYMTGDSAVLNITGGEVSDKWATLNYNAGTVNITGGTIFGGTGTSNVICMQNSDKAKLNISGSATIEGGNFVDVKTPFSKGNIQITGGYYKNDGVKDYLTEDYWLVNSTSKNGYYEVKGAERVAIGNARYSTLTKALNSAKSGDTITLLEDVEKNTFVVPLDMKLTLDLNGHKLSQVIKGEANDTDKDAQSKAVIDSKYLNSELTVKDSSSAKTGSISGFVKVSDGTINWESGDLTSGGVVLSGEDAVFNMKGGTFTPAPVTQTIALKYGTFNGTGGTIKAGSGYAIDLYSKENAVLKLSGSITISGAPVCDAIKAFKNGKVDISGGFYMTTWADAINQLLTDDYSLIESTAKSGYSEVKAFERVAIGATTYPSLTKALAAANNGDTIKILMDAETKATVSKEVTIDLQDCTLTAKDSSGAITVAQGGSLTLGTTGAGKVNKGSSKYAIKNAGGKLVITSGVFQGVANAAAGAATEITGGHFTSGLANTDGAKFAISGGWFPTAVPDSYVAEGLYPTNKFPELGGEGTEYTVGHRVTLDLNYQGSDGLWHFVGPVTGFRMNKPNTPIREDYIFLSWYTDKECTKEFSFDTVIQENTVLYAKWKMEDPWKDNCPGNCKHEVAVGTRHYKTLKDAINNAASGSEIVLLKDIAAGVTVPSGKSFTIDLKGHIIGPETSEKPIIENKGTLVIKDSSAGSKGKISISKMNGEQVAVENYEGTLTLVSGTINNANERISTISNKGGTLNINGGTVNSELGYAIYNGGSQTRAGTVNMTGGEVTAATYQAIWTLSSGYVTVSGGKVYSGRYYAIEAGGYDADNNPWNGYVTINGGQVISRASEANMAAILNFAGTVNINSNEKNDKYPQIVGKIPLISNSKFSHSNNISGGWFSSKLGTDDPSTKYMRNGVVLYPTDAIKSGPSGAQYTIGYRIAFDENHGDGRMHYSYTLPEDGTVAKPANPIRLGYIFSGWFRDPAGVTAFNFEDEKASGSMTLYAVWAEGAQLSITGQKMVVGNYVLTIKAVSQGGTIVAAPLSGTQVKITLTPAAGYKPGSFFMDGNYVNDGYSSYKLTISGDTTISATFKPATMSAEEYRASVEQDKLRQEEGTLEFGTVTDAERERTTTTPAETKDKGGPRTSGDEDYDETGNGSGKPATGEDGEPYDPGEQYEKEIHSGGGQGGGQGSGQSGTDKEQNWFFVEEEFYEEETGTDSKGWTYVGEDVEKYIPSESELEHLERIDPTLPVKDQIAQAKEILAKFNLKTKSGLAVSPKGKGAVKIVWYDEKYSMDVLDGVENFRSTKKGEGYGKKPMLSSVTGRYYNTAIKNNQKYYYKVRGYIKIDGERYYTEWSDETSKVAKRLTASVNKQVMKSSRSPEEGKLQVTLVKQASIKKYQIRYSDKDPAMESGYGQVYMKDNSKYKTTQSKTFSDKELIRSGEYVYVKARAVYTKADGSTGYGGWSNVMKVKIR